MESRIAYGYVCPYLLDQFRFPEAVSGYVAALVRYAEERGLDLGAPVTAKYIGDAFNLHVVGSRERIVLEDARQSRAGFFNRSAGRKLAGALRPDDHLIVAPWDRLGRRIKDCSDAIERLIDRGVKVHVTGFPTGISVEVDSPAGIWFRHWLLASGSHFIRRNAERVLEAQLVARREGRSISNTPRVGFKFVGTGRDRHEVPDERQLAVLRRICEWQDRGWGFEKIARELRRLRVPALRRNRHDLSRWGVELGEYAIRTMMRAAKKMRPLLTDDRIDDDGLAYLAALDQQAEDRSVALVAKRRERLGRATRARLQRISG